MHGRKAHVHSTITCMRKVVKIDRLMELVGRKKAFLPSWAYFGFKPTTDRSKVDKTAPVCHLCEANVSAKLGNTSNLMSHLASVVHLLQL